MRAPRRKSPSAVTSSSWTASVPRNTSTCTAVKSVPGAKSVRRSIESIGDAEQPTRHATIAARFTGASLPHGGELGLDGAVRAAAELALVIGAHAHGLAAELRACEVVAH